MIREWLLARLLKGRIVLFDNGKAIHRINDIYFDDGVVMCKYDKRWEYD